MRIALMHQCLVRHLSLALVLVGLPLLLRAQNPNDPCSLLDNQFAISAYNGDDTTIAGLLQAGCDPNSVDPSSHIAPLIYAIAKQHVHTALLLTYGNAQVNVTNQNGWSALHLAVNAATSASDDHEWLELISALLDHGAFVDTPTPNGWTPLSIASFSPEHTALIQLLLAHHANLKQGSDSGYQLLANALLAQWNINKTIPMDTVRLLLASGVPPDPGTYSPSNVFSMSYAVNPETATPQSAPLLAFLLAAHAHPNQPLPLDSEDGKSVQVPPLFFALMHPNPAIAQMLVLHGAETETSINWGSVRLPVLAQACQIGPQRIREMVNLGADFTWTPPDDKDVPGDPVSGADPCWTPPNLAALVDVSVNLQQGLVNATAYGSENEIQALIDAGADESSTGSIFTSSSLPDGSLLRYAAEQNDDPVGAITTLLAFGVDPLDLGAGDEHNGASALDVLDKQFADDKTNDDYLSARKILFDAMQQRRITKGFIASALARLADDVRFNRPRQKDEILLFRDALERYAADSDSIELRVFIASIEAHGLALPPTPVAAALAAQATSAYAQAHSRSDLLPVAVLFERALRLSPWTGEYYLALVRIYHLTGSQDRAIRYAAMTYDVGLADLSTLEAIVFGHPVHVETTTP